MKSLKLIGDAEIDADPLLHRRGSVLRDQHRQLLSLFRRFRLHGETMQRICRRTGQDRPPSDDVETSADGDDIWQSDDDVMDTEVTMRLHPASGEFVSYRKRARSRDEAGDSESDCTPEAVCVQSRGIPVASSSSCSASLHCAGKNTSDVIVLGSTADICGMTGRRREDEDQAPACESSASVTRSRTSSSSQPPRSCVFLRPLPRYYPRPAAVLHCHPHSYRSAVLYTDHLLRLLHQATSCLCLSR